MKKRKKKFVLKYKEISPGEYRADHKCPPHIWSQDKTSETGEWDCIFGDKSSYTAPDCDHCGVLEKDVVREYPPNYDEKKSLMAYHMNLSHEIVKKLAKRCKTKHAINSLVCNFLKEEFPDEFDPAKHIFRIEYIENFLYRDGRVSFFESNFRRVEVETNQHVLDLMNRCSCEGKGNSFLSRFLNYKLK